MSHFHSPAAHSHSHETAPETTGATIRWAGRYDAIVSLLTLGQEGDIRKKTIALAQLKPGESVLDVGCGTGALTREAKKQVGAGRVIGIDASPEMITSARQKAANAHLDIDFRLEPIERLPFPDASFDVVLSSFMIHHLPGDLKRQGLLEVRRVLKPTGRLFIAEFINDPNPKWWQSFLPMHAQMGLPQDLLPSLLTQTGFTDFKTGGIKFGTIGYISAHPTPTKPNSV
jgi:demethylmenaquinone methyltransferase/2-methoxy-6-polyprenyl-1,4-benzoquinol methylase/phosphoethanolamine N-methyltransferase